MLSPRRLNHHRPILILTLALTLLLSTRTFGIPEQTLAEGQPQTLQSPEANEMPPTLTADVPGELLPSIVPEEPRIGKIQAGIAFFDSPVHRVSLLKIETLRYSGVIRNTRTI